MADGRPDEGATVHSDALRQSFADCVDEMVRRLDRGHSTSAQRHELPFAPEPGSLTEALGPTAVDHGPRIREMRREMGIVAEVDRVFLIELASAARQRAPASDRWMSADARKIARSDDVDPLAALLQRPGALQRLARLADDLLPVEERVGPMPDPLDVWSWLALPPDLRIEPKQAIEHGAPEHGLPPTPRNTFYRWVRNDSNRELLGFDKRHVTGPVPPVLVAGLLQLHASNRRKTMLAPCAPNARLSGKHEGPT